MHKLHVIHLDTSSSKIGFAFDKPNDKIAIFNCLVTECLDRHAPLKRIKMTQPPVPWLNDQSIGSLQVNLANQPQEAHASPLKEGEWDMFKQAKKPDQEGQTVVYDHCAFLKATKGGIEDTLYSPSKPTTAPC